jgi:hypothetical protein
MSLQNQFEMTALHFGQLPSKRSMSPVVSLHRLWPPSSTLTTLTLKQRARQPVGVCEHAVSFHTTGRNASLPIVVGVET